MAYAEIDLTEFKEKVNAILDHLIVGLGIRKVEIEKDQYWHCPTSEIYEMAKTPLGLDIGSLKDDLEFTKLITREQSGDISYNLVHVAPLLRYIGEKIKK